MHDTPPSCFEAKHISAVTALFNCFLQGDTSLVLPGECEQTPVPNVCLVEFVDVEGTTGHPAPDALLLAIKASLVWSKFHKQPLIVGGSVSDDKSNRSMGLDEIAEEHYLEAVRLLRCSEIPPVVHVKNG